MAKLTCKLSTRTNEEGEAEIIIRGYIDRTHRPQLRTHLFIKPEYFGYGMVLPPSKKYELAEQRKAFLVQSALEAFKSRFMAVLNAFSGHPEEIATQDDVQRIMDMVTEKGILTEEITYHRLVQEREIIRKDELEELAQLAAVEAEAARRKEHDFYALADEYIRANDHKNGTLSDDRKRATRVLIRDVHRWEEYTRRTKDKNFFFDVDNVRPDEIRDFLYYLQDEARLSRRHPEMFREIIESYPNRIVEGRVLYEIGERSQNAIVKLAQILRAIFNWLIRREIITNDPMRSVKIGRERYGDVTQYISVEERNQIATFVFPESPNETALQRKYRQTLNEQRDIFIFHCNIGCRVSDLVKLTAANISVNSDGEKVLSYTPSKTADETGATARIPLTDEALALVEKYEGVDKHGRLFPFISPQNYNENIKKIFTAVGITRKVEVRNPQTGCTEFKPLNEIASSHLARRTFVNTAYHLVKDPNIVGKMSGHVAGSKAFARYHKTTDDLLSEVVKSDAFTGKTSLRTKLTQRLQSLSDEQLAKLEQIINTL